MTAANAECLILHGKLAFRTRHPAPKFHQLLKKTLHGNALRILNRLGTKPARCDPYDANTPQKAHRSTPENLAPANRKSALDQNQRRENALSQKDATSRACPGAYLL